MSHDEEFHGRELRRLEQKAAKALLPAPPAFDELAAFRMKLEARPAARVVKEVRDVFRGALFRQSDKRLEDLVAVDLPDLNLGQRSEGATVLVRIIRSPYSLSDPLYTTVTLPVASSSGRCTLLRLRCYPVLPASLGRPTEADVEDVFPEGSILAVKEPRLDRDLLSDEVGIDVYSPADVQALVAGDRLLEGVQWEGEGGAAWEVPPIEQLSLAEWTNRGDEAVVSSRYREALRCFTLGISQHSDEPEASHTYRRRAAVNLTLERYSSALGDAQKVLDAESDTNEALEIKARALYLLRRWSRALAAYQKLRDCSAASPAASAGIDACEARLREAETGVYDIPALFRTSLAGPEGGVALIIDVADYVGPVKIGPSPTTGGGRGLVTTRDVRPGEVLLAVRAVAAASASDLPTSPRLVVYNLDQNIVDMSTSLAYVQNVLWRLKDQPELGPKIYDLYLGDDEQTPADFPLAASTEAIKEATPLDSKAVFKASFWNASFPHRVLSVPDLRGDVIAYQDDAAPGALFSESAMINHSCAWTVSHTFFGDFQITRANQFIPAGAEVFASYVPDLPLAFRQPRLAKFFGVCQCSLCQEDTRDPGVRERADKVIRIIRETSDDETTFADIKAFDATSNSQLAAVVKRRTEMARELDATYGADREMARVDLFFGWEALRAPLRAIAERKAKEKEYLAWGRNEVRALVALGVDFTTESVMGLATPTRFEATPTALDGSLPIRTPPPFRPVEAARSLVLLASISGRIANLPVTTAEATATWAAACRAWLRAAAWVEHLYIGGGREMFAERWQAVLAFEGLTDTLADVDDL